MLTATPVLLAVAEEELIGIIPSVIKLMFGIVAVAVKSGTKPIEPPEPTPVTACESAVAVFTSICGFPSVISVTL